MLNARVQFIKCFARVDTGTITLIKWRISARCC